MLTDEELEKNIRKDYPSFTIKEQTGMIQDILIWTRETQEEATLKAVGKWLRSQAHESTIGYLFITRELDSVIRQLEAGQMPEVKE